MTDSECDEQKPSMGLVSVLWHDCDVQLATGLVLREDLSLLHYKQLIVIHVKINNRINYQISLRWQNLFIEIIDRNLVWSRNHVKKTICVSTRQSREGSRTLVNRLVISNYMQFLYTLQWCISCCKRRIDFQLKYTDISFLPISWWIFFKICSQFFVLFTDYSKLSDKICSRPK